MSVKLKGSRTPEQETRLRVLCLVSGLLLLAGGAVLMYATYGQNNDSLPWIGGAFIAAIGLVLVIASLSWEFFDFLVALFTLDEESDLIEKIVVDVGPGLSQEVGTENVLTYECSESPLVAFDFIHYMDLTK